jgi:hypothetical protein
LTVMRAKMEWVLAMRRSTKCTPKVLLDLILL